MRKVLIVDDDAAILEVFTLLLTMHGYEAHSLSAGDKFLALIEKIKPDVILLDLFIAGADGRELCKQIKSDRAFDNIAVIMFSGNAKIKYIYEGCNADDYIEKPFEARELNEKIEKNIKVFN